MTKLEEEIANSLPFAHSVVGYEWEEVPDEYLERAAKAAAEVALERRLFNKTSDELRNQWLKENGIIRVLKQLKLIDESRELNQEYDAIEIARALELDPAITYKEFYNGEELGKGIKAI